MRSHATATMKVADPLIDYASGDVVHQGSSFYSMDAMAVLELIRIGIQELHFSHGDAVRSNGAYFENISEGALTGGSGPTVDSETTLWALPCWHLCPN